MTSQPQPSAAESSHATSNIFSHRRTGAQGIPHRHALVADKKIRRSSPQPRLPQSHEPRPLRLEQLLIPRRLIRRRKPSCAKDFELDGACQHRRFKAGARKTETTGAIRSYEMPSKKEY